MIELDPVAAAYRSFASAIECAAPDHRKRAAHFLALRIRQFAAGKAVLEALATATVDTFSSGEALPAELTTALRMLAEQPADDDQSDAAASLLYAHQAAHEGRIDALKWAGDRFFSLLDGDTPKAAVELGAVARFFTDWRIDGEMSRVWGEPL